VRLKNPRAGRRREQEGIIAEHTVKKGGPKGAKKIESDVAAKGAVKTKTGKKNAVSSKSPKKLELRGGHAFESLHKRRRENRGTSLQVLLRKKKIWREKKTIMSKSRFSKKEHGPVEKKQVHNVQEDIILASKLNSSKERGTEKGETAIY